MLIKNTHFSGNNLIHRLIKYSALVVSVIAMYWFIEHRVDLPVWFLLADQVSIIKYMGVLATISIVMIALFYAWLTFHALSYKPVQAVNNNDLPTITVIVPAYNEGELVYHTLISLCASDYPHEKIQIIAVDDGSKDDTWLWISKACQETSDRITPIQLNNNSGKRIALYKGFQNADADILITIDSDCIIENHSLKHLVSPFVIYPECGAVAGNIRVLNQTRFIPKMLDVSFVFSFEFVRAAQSNIGTVLCTPGALSAYRNSLVQELLPEWLNQKFLGQDAKIGEDRALTNMILSRGYQVLFQSTAIIHTAVPEKFNKLSKMFIRWGRSNVRENFKMLRYVFKQFRATQRTEARLLFFMQIWLSTMAVPLYTLLIILVINYPMLILVSALAANVMWGLLHTLVYIRYYKNTNSLWSFAYGIYHFVSLSWISSYSFLTMWRSSWLTRNIQDVTIDAKPLEKNI